MKPNIFKFLCSVFINYNRNIMRLLGFIFSLILSASINVFAQNTTYILVRHAEKDTSPMASKTNPDLTAEGKQRAGRLFELVKPYQPEYIFSTTFQRTISTLLPTAENLLPNYRVQMQFYDFSELEDFAAKLLKLKTKSVVVVGHNTTTPELANLLIGKEKYKALGDNEYNKAFIIKINGTKIEDKVIEY